MCGGTINSDSYPSYTGIGTVVGIVLFCLVFLASVFLAKKYKKFCFSLNNHTYGVTKDAGGNVEVVEPLNDQRDNDVAAEDEKQKSDKKVDSENEQKDDRRLTV